MSSSVYSVSVRVPVSTFENWPILLSMSSNQSSNNIFQQYEEAKKLGGKFVKLSSGEWRTLQFNMNKIAIVDSEFEGKKTEGKSFEFTVIDPREPQSEKVLSIGVKKAEGIMTLL